MQLFLIILVAGVILTMSGGSVKGDVPPPGGLFHLPIITKPKPPLASLSLVFTSNRNTNWEIYKMRGDGSHQTRLTFSAAWDVSPAWSPDGKRILFSSNRNNDIANFDLYIMNTDGSEMVRLTNTPESESYADWSSDGSRVIYFSQPDLYSIKPDGTDIKRITNFAPLGIFMDYPVLSPDGKQVAFVDSTTNLSVIHIDGSSLEQLTEMPWATATSMSRPSWSPDGKQITFAYHESWTPFNQPVRVYVVRAVASGKQVRLLCFGNLPSWSPDGSRIAYLSVSDYVPQREPRIAVIDVDGSNNVMLTTLEQGVNSQPGWGPAWTDQ